ncbi:hypothetical protein HHO41_09135 [Bacillus sp. DNRA2]|uniref:hypothetical protein n=1 Tax=Bacillus sp. DNRA2 TaxID=2723053 RepID=UPI00145CDAAA|nr:hypothetical protein [Bacillus sp. DNRA2]NMD70454.1 hypothetical protein [Bacillus sp. DNRA2]
MIPAFLLNKLVSRILSHVLERTDEHHARLNEKLALLENELFDLKQNKEIQTLKSDVQQKELPSITIDHITIENIQVISSEIPTPLLQHIQHPHPRKEEHNKSPKINIKTRY